MTEFDPHDWKDYDLRSIPDLEPRHLYVDLYLICTYEVYPGNFDSKEQWWTIFLGVHHGKDIKNVRFRGKLMRLKYGERDYKKFGCSIVEATYYVHKYLR